MNYFISDQHFGHEHVISMDKRPFQSTEEMEAKMVDAWNWVVTSKDDVWILGDMCWKTSVFAKVIPQLRGKKHLIVGNHDKLNFETRKLFTSIDDKGSLHTDMGHVVMSHFPIAHWRGQYRGSYHLYGHVHQTQDFEMFLKYKRMCKEANIPFNAYNVGCMLPYMDYRPRTLEEIVEGGDKFEQDVLDGKVEFVSSRHGEPAEED